MTDNRPKNDQHWQEFQSVLQNRSDRLSSENKPSPASIHLFVNTAFEQQKRAPTLFINILRWGILPVAAAALTLVIAQTVPRQRHLVVSPDAPESALVVPQAHIHSTKKIPAAPQAITSPNNDTQATPNAAFQLTNQNKNLHFKLNQSRVRAEIRSTSHAVKQTDQVHSETKTSKSPNPPPSLEFEVMTLMSQGNFKQAVTKLHAHLRSRPNDYKAQLLLADCHRKQQNWNDALRVYEEIIDSQAPLKSRNMARYRAGILHQDKMKNHDRAAFLFRRYLEKSQKGRLEADAMIRLARSLDALGQKDAALNIWQQVATMYADIAAGITARRHIEDNHQ